MRGLGRVERLARAILPRVQPGELGAHLGGGGRELDRLLVRGDRFVDLALALEVASQQEVVAGARLGRGRTRAWAAAAAAGPAAEPRASRRWKMPASD